jgi:hypothetical protein
MELRVVVYLQVYSSVVTQEQSLITIEHDKLFYIFIAVNLLTRMMISIESRLRLSLNCGFGIGGKVIHLVENSFFYQMIGLAYI